MKKTENFTKWFEENMGRSPNHVDYVREIVKGSTQEERDAAGREFARTFILPDGSISNVLLPPEITMNYQPNNAFFLEWEEKIPKFILNDNKAYSRWYKESEPQRAEWKAKLLQKKRVIAVNNAYKNHPNAVKVMKDLSTRWENFEKNGLLTHAVNVSLAGKFMDELRKDPTLKMYLPPKLVDNPGTRLSAPLYDEVRNFVQNEKEEYEGFFAIKGDFRTSAMSQLRQEADKDFDLRKNPALAKEYAQRLKQRRAQVEVEAQKKGLTKEPTVQTPKKHRASMERS